MSTLLEFDTRTRTDRFLAKARQRALAARENESPKMKNWSDAFFDLYGNEPSLRRRQALSFAHALRNEPVVVHDDELLVGQIYQGIDGSGSCDISGSGCDPRWKNYDSSSSYGRRLQSEIPELPPLIGWNEGHWVTGSPDCPGHIGWHYDWILKDGVTGLLDRIARSRANLPEDRREFLDGMKIVLESMLDWADLHVAELERRLPAVPNEEQNAWREKIEICRHVPRFGARTFREALQSFHFSYMATIFENPHGGNGPGRLDYYLWPYLEGDLAKGIETLESVRERIDELFIRFHERIGFRWDGWVETIVVGGSHPDGSSAVNPLSRIMIESIGALKISHPSVYMRMPENPPEDWVDLAVRDLREGGNRAQILNDSAIVKAMTRNGDIPVADARMYMCGGCMEISPQGMNSDLLFTSFFNTAKVLELVINGGVCMNTGRTLLPEWRKTLADFTSFEDLYMAFESELRRLLHMTFRATDIASEEYARWRPRFLVSSQVEDCIARGRGINDGGAKYEDYGSTPLGIPNLGDSLYAIKRAVFDERFISAADMLTALRRNFEGDTVLRARLLALPKFGQGFTDADAMTNRVLRSVCDAYDSYRNRFGRRVKPIIMTFMMAPVAGKALAATADGRFAGKPIAQGVTPQSMAMTQGLTTAMLSANSLDLARFSGGAASMWDLDSEYAQAATVKAILKTFLATGGQMYQGNMTDVRTLEKAQISPDDYRNLMVRVGGFSGVFVECDPAVRDEIISRKRHGK